MNKIISVYELLGLIKDGKAPKKIKWDNVEWEFKEEFDDYFRNGTYLTTEGFDIFNSAKDFLEDKIEILEEDKPIIEKLYIGKNDITYDDGAIDADELVDNFIDVKDKLNEVIEFLNNKFNH